MRFWAGSVDCTSVWLSIKKLKMFSEPWDFSFKFLKIFFDLFRNFKFKNVFKTLTTILIKIFFQKWFFNGLSIKIRSSLSYSWKVKGDINWYRHWPNLTLSSPSSNSHQRPFCSLFMRHPIQIKKHSYQIIAKQHMTEHSIVYNVVKYNLHLCKSISEWHEGIECKRKKRREKL